jgi:hypothetical protein
MTYQEMHNYSSSDAQKIRRKVKEINLHVQGGKPCYWDQKLGDGDQATTVRYRVFRARFSKGRFEIIPLSKNHWMAASLVDKFELCR